MSMSKRHMTRWHFEMFADFVGACRRYVEPDRLAYFDKNVLKGFAVVLSTYNPAFKEDKWLDRVKGEEPCSPTKRGRAIS